MLMEVDLTEPATCESKARVDAPTRLRKFHIYGNWGFVLCLLSLFGWLFAGNLVAKMTSRSFFRHLEGLITSTR